MAASPAVARTGGATLATVVHFYRDVFSLVPAGEVRDVAKMLKPIHAQESRKAATEKTPAVIAELKAVKLTTAAELPE